MELDDCRLPGLVKGIKLCLLLLNNVGVESVAVFVLGGILRIFIGYLLLHELVHLWRQEESNINELLAHSTQVRSTALLLEGLEVVKPISEGLNLIFALAPLLVDLLPDAIDVADLVCEE